MHFPKRNEYISLKKKKKACARMSVTAFVLNGPKLETTQMFIQQVNGCTNFGIFIQKNAILQ